MVQKLEARGNGRFPNAKEIASLPESELREAGFGYRAKTIVETARRLASLGPQWLTDLTRAPYPDAFRALNELPGIGPKLADCICLYGLHHGEAVPVDTHLWKAACRHFFPEYASRSLTGRRYREIGNAFRSRFGKLAGWAQLFLYFDNLERGRSRRRL